MSLYLYKLSDNLFRSNLIWFEMIFEILLFCNKYRFYKLKAQIYIWLAPWDYYIYYKYVFAKRMFFLILYLYFCEILVLALLFYFFYLFLFLLSYLWVQNLMCHGVHGEIKGQCLAVDYFLPPWVLAFDFRWSNLLSMCFYLLNHLASPAFIFQWSGMFLQFCSDDSKN